jgi:hypothetical protein
VQYTLNCKSVACTGVDSGNWGTVTLTDIGGGKINVAVVMASGVELGANNQNAFLWNGTGNDTLTISNLTSNASAFAIQGAGANGTYAPPSPFNTSGAAFDYAINRTNNGGTPTTLSFDLTKSGGLTLANFATTDDNGAFYFGALVKQSGSTFFVAANQAGVKVPEPGTLTLSIAGLAGLAGLVLLQRRRYRVRAH